LVSCKAKAIALAPTTWSQIIHLRDGCETSERSLQPGGGFPNVETYLLESGTHPTAHPV
ncbi:unnamed protein product, partial [Scytosiphon promiscuus]